MTRSSAAVSLVLVGSALAYGVYRYSQQPDDNDPNKEKNQGHTGGSGHATGGIYRTGGSSSGSKSGAVSSPRGGFGSTGRGASAGS